MKNARVDLILRLLKALLLTGLFLTAGAFTGAHAQDNEEFKARMDSILNPSVLQEEVLSFSSTTHAVGMLTEKDEPVSHTFHFRNVSGADVTVTRINTSCSCLTVSHDRPRIAPGEEGEVTLTFNPRNFTGKIFVKAFLYTTLSESHPAAILSLTGEVRLTDPWRHLPERTGTLRLRTKSLDFDRVLQGNVRYERIPCANAGEAPLEISPLFLPDYATFAVLPAVIQPGEEADIIVTIDAAALNAEEDRSKPVGFRFMLTGTGGWNPFRKLIKVTVQPMDE